MNRIEAYHAANARAERTKAAFLGSLSAAKARIAPARLKNDVRQKVAHTMMGGAAGAAARVQERPFAFGAAAGALTIFLARKPLAALFRRLYVKFTSQTDNPETDDV